METLYPTYLHLAYAHLATVVPAFLIGGYLLLRAKGTPSHRGLGRIYVALMLSTAIIALFMPAQVGPSLGGHFGLIHIFSAVVLVCIPLAIRAARRHQLIAHRAHMLGVYVGGVLIAGAFALMPGRLLHGWLFG
ncbi:DUF2306 domain-containing protein [Pseudomonas sp. MYb185]|uniref:DUF2306 domain-containing protein n=1 Tax=Pseudomonas sp. MYb185 TaxID=1848729 RepID=UPI000CFC91AF|nr:DUF2306 domain-containing protein [Pseudomonas sp. MYb185]PRB79953.1 hypothetical protein CQ007_14010 [Pseudomonas sp. MYb185]